MKYCTVILYTTSHFKIGTHLASGLFAECGIPNCKAVIRSLIYKFMSRLNESTNDVILAILSSDIRWTSRIRRYWVKTLYVHHDLV